MKKTMRALALLCMLALLCVLANAAAVWIDTPAMRANAAQGAAMLGEQGATPQLTGGFKTAQLDNFTAVLILKTAAYTGGETALARTFGGFRTDLRAAEGENAWLAFCRYADGRESPTGGLSYSRYWHGYTLPLRLLLCFLNLANIQMLLLAAQGVMLICVVLLLQRRGMLRLAPGFLAAFFLMMPPVTGLCLQYVPVTLLMLCACAALLAGEKGITQSIGMPGFFAAAGMLTAYFDLFTFPMVSLCFPLVMLLACRMQEGKSASALWQEGLFAAAAWGADLVLSGHFHGGTIRLPGGVGLMTPQFQFFRREVVGRHEAKAPAKTAGPARACTMLVSAGLGTHSINLRINNRPEIVLAVLQPGNEE